MLTAQQQAFVQALEELDLQQVQRLLTDGLSLNFIDPEKGPVISVWSDGLFKWWEAICEAYEAGAPLSEQEKQQTLAVHLDILEQLIHGKANLHLWDTEEIYGHFGMLQVLHVRPRSNVYWMKKLIQTPKMKMA